MGKVLIAIALFFAVIIFLRMRNERIDNEQNRKETDDAEKNERRG